MSRKTDTRDACLPRLGDRGGAVEVEERDGPSGGTVRVPHPPTPTLGTGGTSGLAVLQAIEATTTPTAADQRTDRVTRSVWSSSRNHLSLASKSSGHVELSTLPAAGGPAPGPAQVCLSSCVAPPWRRASVQSRARNHTCPGGVSRQSWGRPPLPIPSSRPSTISPAQPGQGLCSSSLQIGYPISLSSPIEPAQSETTRPQT